MRVEAFFLPAEQGSRFCLLHEPALSKTSRAIVFVHAFAEEMNKSRRVVALQSRAFAAAGWNVLQPDLYGCGDSAGHFAEADWQRWIADIVHATEWLRARTGCPPVLWGLRAGCLLAAEVAKTGAQVAGLVLWQPVVSGRQYLQQFLRLRSVSGIMGQARGEAESTQDLRATLGNGQAVEVAGYRLSPALALGLEAAELDTPPPSSPVAWMEVRSSGGTLSPPSSARIERWQAAGVQVESRCVPGEAFWQNLEVADCPALVESTLALTQRWGR